MWIHGYNFGSDSLTAQEIDKIKTAEEELANAERARQKASDEFHKRLETDPDLRKDYDQYSHRGNQSKNLELAMQDITSACQRRYSAKQRLTCLSISIPFDRNTVNGVIYPTAKEADLVRTALKNANIAHHYPGTPEAKKVLKPLGLS